VNFNDAGGVEVAAGPNHLVEVVKSTVAVFDKVTGDSLFQSSLAKFFDPVGIDPDFKDPVVAYDEQTERFIVALVGTSSGGDFLAFAVSNPSNPLAGFTEKRIDFPFPLHPSPNDPRGTRDQADGHLRIGWNTEAYVFTLDDPHYVGICCGDACCQRP